MRGWTHTCFANLGHPPRIDIGSAQQSQLTLEASRVHEELKLTIQIRQEQSSREAWRPAGVSDTGQTLLDKETRLCAAVRPWRASILNKLTFLRASVAATKGGGVAGNFQVTWLPYSGEMGVTASCAPPRSRDREHRMASWLP